MDQVRSVYRPRVGQGKPKIEFPSPTPRPHPLRPRYALRPRVNVNIGYYSRRKTGSRVGSTFPTWRCPAAPILARNVRASAASSCAAVKRDVNGVRSIALWRFGLVDARLRL